ncbi:ribosomal subunit interface protein [Cellulomonas marina]|uniref:Ribosome hibernation promoting factor n=1 Tax=Cellulomonas marina TaxID=988821 RepID=A0A1I0V0A7_9CELL|nr:ribosomal subunit interface protein [Cellulomonas marina]SFA69748.1 ribosomal subunit interface protein [Cellulomonas marina]
MEIVVAGRHTDVLPKFRAHAEQKLAKVAQLAPRAQRIDVMVTHEANAKPSGVRERVELTVIDKGPVIRAEACADDRNAALDLALARLLERLRRSHDRRKDHHGRAPLTPMDVRPPEPVEPAPEPAPDRMAAGTTTETTLGDSPVVIREKVHEAQPMTVDDAIYEMELVGHDFFLFVDAETAQPSVAYRRRGWTYGVIKLDMPVAGLGTRQAATGGDAVADGRVDVPADLDGATRAAPLPRPAEPEREAVPAR